MFLVIAIFQTLIAFNYLVSKDDYFFYPGNFDSNQSAFSVGLSVSKLPKLIGEDMVQQLPVLFVDYRYGLGDGFSILGSMKTIVLTSHFSAGLLWAVSTGDFAFSIENNFTYWYGFANFSGVDASVNGFNLLPAIRIGYAVGNVCITSKSEVTLQTFLSRKVVEVEVEKSKERLSTISTALYFEQTFINDFVVLIGFKFNYSRYYEPSWLAFATTKSWLFIPEFVIGVNL